VLSDEEENIEEPKKKADAEVEPEKENEDAGKEAEKVEDKEEEAEKVEDKEEEAEKVQDKDKDSENMEDKEKEAEKEKEVEASEENQEDAEKAEDEPEKEVEQEEEEEQEKMDEDPKPAEGESDEPAEKPAENDNSREKSDGSLMESLRQLIEAKETEMKEMKTKNEARMKEMKTKNEARMKELKAQSESSLKKQEEDFKKQETVLKKQLSEQEQKSKQEQAKAKDEYKKSLAKLKKSMEDVENKQINSYEPALVEKVGLLPAVWIDVYSLDKRELKSIFQDRKLDWAANSPKEGENRRRLAVYLESQALKPGFENKVGIRVNGVGGNLPGDGTKVMLAIRGRFFLMEKGQNYRFVADSELDCVQFQVTHDGSRWSCMLHLKKGRIDTELPLLDARNNLSDFTLKINMFIEQKLNLPGTCKIVSTVKNASPNNLVDWYNSPGVKIRTLAKRYFGEMRGYDFLLFGCKSMAEYLSNFPELELSTTHAKLKMSAKQKAKLKEMLAEIEKNKPKKPKIIPPQMKIPEDKNKSSKIVYMKNQYGVPKESVRLGCLFIELKFVNNCWSEEYQNKVLSSLGELANFKNTYMTFSEGDKVKVTLKNKSKKEEYNNSIGVISGDVKESRYPITIKMGGITKTLRVRPPCLSLVETKMQTVRVNVICANCFQAQVVIKHVKTHFAYTGKVIASYQTPPPDTMAEEKYAVTGMMIVKKTQDPGFIDESPIFEGVGAQITQGNFTDVCIGANARYYFLQSGRFLKRDEEHKSWTWQVLQVSQMETFLKDLKMYDDYHDQLKDYSLPQLASLCFTPCWRGEWYGIVKSEHHRSKIRKSLENLRLPNRHSRSYRDYLKKVDRKTPLKDLKEKEWTLVSVIREALKVRPVEFKKTLTQSYNLTLES